MVVGGVSRGVGAGPTGGGGDGCLLFIIHLLVMCVVSTETPTTWSNTEAAAVMMRPCIPDSGWSITGSYFGHDAPLYARLWLIDH